jgi:hypothetical protein
MDKSLFNKEGLFLNLMKHFGTLLLFFLDVLDSILETISLLHLNFSVFIEVFVILLMLIMYVYVYNNWVS